MSDTLFNSSRSTILQGLVVRHIVQFLQINTSSRTSCQTGLAEPKLQSLSNKMLRSCLSIIVLSVIINILPVSFCPVSLTVLSVSFFPISVTALSVSFFPISVTALSVSFFPVSVTALSVSLFPSSVIVLSVSFFPVSAEILHFFQKDILCEK